TTAPTVTPIGDQSSEVYSPISPIKIATQDNSGNAVTNTVTGLPSGLTFDSTNNTISGTPTNIGTSTITIVSTDASGNKTTTTFKYEVTRNSMSDTTAPTVTPIGDQSSEVYSPISPIKIATQDNSGNAVTNTVTGLPSGLTFDSTNNTISGTPTNIGTSTITIVSTDASGNKTTTTFKYEVTRNSMS
ncbi:Ig domain-containing protein, partial [Staphylococcus aureus]